jgi:hypothetical protein
VIVSAAENDVTGAKRIATFRCVIEVADTDYGMGERDLRDRISYDVNLESTRNCVRPSGEVHPIEVRLIYAIPVNQD